MTEEERHNVAEHSYGNRDEIERSKMCGCYYCERIFPASLIRYSYYTDFGRTATCPFCGIDAVIGDASGVPINKKLLKEMYHNSFDSESGFDTINALEFFDNDEQQ